MATYVVRLAGQAGLIALFVAAALAGTVSGVLFAYADDLPQISALDDYAPSTITRVLGRDGQVIGEYATERRVIVGYDDIPDTLRHAILAAEDADFFGHFGLSIPRILLTLARDIAELRLAAGASTLTQQLARKLFLTDEKTFERKIKEALLAIQIEKRYTKEEIFTLYCNQMYFGHGAYGVEAASQLYFGKRARDLALEEAALIAGILQGNARQSPYVNPDAALRRRNYALARMADEGFVSRDEAEAAKERPIVTRGDPFQGSGIAPYFVEDVRKYLEARYGARALYESGLSVRTSLDPHLQRAANAAVDAGLRRIDKRRGWRRPSRNVLDEGRTLDGFRHERWSRALASGRTAPALVMSVDPRRVRDGRARLRIGNVQAEIGRVAIAWTRRTHPADLVRPGDVIEVAVLDVDAKAARATVRLDQDPLVQGALVALDNRTGRVLAMVGGLDFSRSKFNRATQALRQMGSTFKPFLYAAAVDRGLTPTTRLTDAPTAFNAGAGQPAYMPRNYDGRYVGPLTLRAALEQSRNVPAVRVMEMLGPSQVVTYVHRFGFPAAFPAFLSTALGAPEATLIDLVSAYSAFPNHGIRLQPYLVESVADRTGSTLEERRPAPRDALRADTAFVVTSMLRGVIQRGTATAAAALDWPLAGKTGTVDDYTDAWFVGFDPLVTVGVWVGRDEKKPIGPGETGASAALPIWMDFMRAYLDTVDRSRPPAFEPPGNIVFVPVDRQTGEPVAAGTDAALSEAFISGTQPIRQ